MVLFYFMYFVWKYLRATYQSYK